MPTLKVNKCLLLQACILPLGPKVVSLNPREDENKHSTNQERSKKL